MEIRLSDRLRAIYDMVPQCRCAADIGTDHGYIPCALCLGGRAERAIASDINEGPLLAASENIKKYGLSDRVDLRLGSGFETLRPGEAGCAVISGMGGNLMIDILSQAGDVLTGREVLVLQPQSEIPLVRTWLREKGYAITGEDMVLEGGKYYTVIRAQSTGALQSKECGEDDGSPSGPRDASAKALYMENTVSLQELEDTFGPLLLRQRHPVLLSYVSREEEICRRILSSLLASGGDHSERIKQLRKKEKLIRGALEVLKADSRKQT